MKLLKILGFKFGLILVYIMTNVMAVLLSVFAGATTSGGMFLPSFPLSFSVLFATSAPGLFVYDMIGKNSDIYFIVFTFGFSLIFYFLIGLLIDLSVKKFRELHPRNK